MLSVTLQMSQQTNRVWKLFRIIKQQQKRLVTAEDLMYITGHFCIASLPFSDNNYGAIQKGFHVLLHRPVGVVRVRLSH